MNRRKRLAQDFSGPSITQQHFAASCDVNNIIRHYADMEQPIPQAPPDSFGFQSSTSFSEAMQRVAAVKSAFAELPAQTRSEFDHDPERWLEAQFATPENIPSAASQAPESPEKSVPPTPIEGEIDSA